MQQIFAVTIKEWQQAWASSALWLQIALFAASTMALVFFAGRFFDAGRADLALWFAWVPWVMVLYVPVFAAKSIVHEVETGTLDLIWRGPKSMLVLVLGKWLALSGWVLVGMLFVLPLWIGISWLGSPDHGAILAGLFGAVLMAGAMATIALCASATAKNTNTAALLGVLFSLVLSLPMLGSMLSFLPPAIAEAAAGFSIPARFAGFARGSIAFADVFYFLSLAAAGIWISVLLVGRHYPPRQMKLLLQIPIILLGFLIINLALPRYTMTLRFDATAGQIFTLSAQSRQLAKQLETPKTWTFYYSASLAARYPDIRQFGAQVRQTLASLQAHSNGKLTIVERHPLPDTPLEDQAIAAGLQPVMTDTGAPLYFGIVDKTGALIPRFDHHRARLLEYDLARQLIKPGTNKTNLTLVDETDMAGRDWYITGREETALYRQLSRQFTLSTDAEHAWVWVHPKPFDDGFEANLAARLVDEKKLRMVILVDPYREGAGRLALNGLPRPGAMPSSKLPKAITDLGVSMSSQVVIDPALAAQVQTQENGKSRVISYPAWLQLGPDNIALAGPLQSAVPRGMALASAGAFDAKLTDGWEFQPVLRTSKHAMLVDQRLIANGASTDELLAQGQNTGVKVLAGRLFHGEYDKQILLIADTDFIDDQFYGQTDPVFGWQELADNGRFMMTALDVMIHAPELINLAPKGQMNRPLHKIETMREHAQQQLQTEENRLHLLQAQLTTEMAENPKAQAQLAQKLLETRQQLRGVRHGFRSQIIAIERWLIWLNVILFPLGFAWFGLRRRR